jgi:hypothetical protein
MFKKTLIATAALATLAFGASAANAGYGISIGYGHGYGHGHGHGRGHYNYTLDLSDYDDCSYVVRPVTIKVWDDYSYSYYFKTIHRKVRVCY